VGVCEGGLVNGGTTDWGGALWEGFMGAEALKNTGGEIIWGQSGEKCLRGFVFLGG